MGKVSIITTLLCAALLAGGCASDKYGCKGLPEGTVCKDPVEVYHMTEDRDHVGQPSEKSEKKGDGVSDEQAPKDLLLSGSMLAARPGPKPILESSRVLRVWVAPWIDELNDLHWPGYLFTEVTPKRWAFGESAVGGMQPLIPLQLYRTETEEVKPAEPPGTPLTGSGFAPLARRAAAVPKMPTK